MANVLITGINGFLGKKLAERLLSTNSNTIFGLSRSEIEIENVKIFKGDVLDKKIVNEAMKDIEIVIHLAALTAHVDIVNNKYKTLEVNYQGTKNLLEAFNKSKTSKKFIYASTGKVYGTIKDLPIAESHPTEPLNELGKSKLITEKLIDFYSSDEKSYIIFRIFNVFGEDQKENFLLPTIINQLKVGQEITLGDIQAKRDYTYIDDVIDAFESIVTEYTKKNISIYNICSGIGLSAKDLVEEIGKELKKSIKINVDKTRLRDNEMDIEYGSNEKIHKDINWSPKTSLQEGIRNTLKFYKLL